MKINEIRYDCKVADVVINNDVSKSYLWTLSWNTDVDKSYLKDNSSRMYFTVVNGDIYKMGSSSAVGGIRKTWDTYRSCGMSGQPSDRTHGIHVLIRKELDKGNKVEIYCILSTPVKTTLIDLFGNEVIKEVSIDKLELERLFMDNYESNTGELPVWNFQESGISWPDYIKEGTKLVRNKNMTLEYITHNWKS